MIKKFLVIPFLLVVILVPLFLCIGCKKAEEPAPAPAIVPDVSMPPTTAPVPETTPADIPPAPAADIPPAEVVKPEPHIRETMVSAEKTVEALTSPPVPSNLSEIVENELKKLSSGQILFNPPAEMKVGVQERVEVRIAKTITADLYKGLRGSGKPQVEIIEIGSFMKVRLTGDDFNIKPLSHEEQIVGGNRAAQWEWDVIPLKSGIHFLTLHVTVRLKLPNGDEELIDHPVFDKQIKVHVNPIYSGKKFIISNWEKIIGFIISSGIIGWLVKKWRNKRGINRLQ